MAGPMTHLPWAASDSDRFGVRRGVLIVGGVISMAIEVWLISSMGGGSGAAHNLAWGVIALFLAYVNTLPFLLYKRVVKTTAFSIAGGMCLIGQYVFWLPPLEASIHPDNPLILMWPVALVFSSLLIALTIIALDGVLQLVQGRFKSGELIPVSPDLLLTVPAEFHACLDGPPYEQLVGEHVCVFHKLGGFWKCTACSFTDAAQVVAQAHALTNGAQPVPSSGDQSPQVGFRE